MSIKTAVVWIEYYADGKDSIYTCEYATYGEEGTEYPTVKKFLDALKHLAQSAGYRLSIKNVVIG